MSLIQQLWLRIVLAILLIPASSLAQRHNHRTTAELTLVAAFGLLISALWLAWREVHRNNGEVSE
jgi:hypothetical protein